MKYECEVLREDAELKGDVHPHSVFDQCMGESHETLRMHLKLRMFFCLDKLTIRLVASVDWAIKIYIVCLLNKE